MLTRLFYVLGRGRSVQPTLAGKTQIGVVPSIPYFTLERGLKFEVRGGLSPPIVRQVNRRL